MSLRVVACLLFLSLVLSFFTVACSTGDGGACSSNSQCPSGSSTELPDSCFSPGLDFCGPAEGGPTCGSDSDCTEGEVCDQNTESQLKGFGMLVCVAPCVSDDDCALNYACGSGGHCTPRTCAQCPSYFSCATGACTAATCDDDTQCPGGFCVTGQCAPTRGICQSPCQ